MSVKIERRNLRAWLEESLKSSRFLPEWAGFWEEVLHDDALWQLSDAEPVKVSTPWGISTWMYKDARFDVSGYSDLPDKEIKLLIRDALDREHKKLERLRSRYNSGDSGQFRRVNIPDDVRMFVWQRDGGACEQCGSNRKLEYDHIIPVSKGGSSTARNLRLLCEECNKAKADSI